jgi:hypothetical protein
VRHIDQHLASRLLEDVENRAARLPTKAGYWLLGIANVVLVTSPEGTQWLAEITQRRQYELLADWAEQSKIADRLLPLPREFDAHRLAAYRDNDQGDR